MSWQIRLLIDGVDVSASLINVLRIEAEEGTARIAEFSLVAHQGPSSVTKWIGKSVNINYVLDDVDELLFQGVVDEPIYNPTTKITTTPYRRQQRAIVV